MGCLMIDIKKIADRFRTKKDAKEEKATDAIFPSWKYHATLKPRLVFSDEDVKNLGPGWENSPAYFEKKGSK